MSNCSEGAPCDLDGDTAFVSRAEGIAVIAAAGVLALCVLIGFSCYYRRNRRRRYSALDPTHPSKQRASSQASHAERFSDSVALLEGSLDTCTNPSPMVDMAYSQPTPTFSIISTPGAPLAPTVSLATWVSDKTMCADPSDAAVITVPLTESPRLGLELLPRLTVASTYPGSAAANEGLDRHVGKYVTHVNQLAIEDISDVTQRTKDCKRPALTFIDPFPPHGVEEARIGKKKGEPLGLILHQRLEITGTAPDCHPQVRRHVGACVTHIDGVRACTLSEVDDMLRYKREMGRETVEVTVGRGFWRRRPDPLPPRPPPPRREQQAPEPAEETPRQGPIRRREPQRRRAGVATDGARPAALGPGRPAGAADTLVGRQAPAEVVVLTSLGMPQPPLSFSLADAVFRVPHVMC
ncbi:hypothetical protein DIPPA_34637 [Diplonema papillatum]|nr:hypothetical protein DIPPA_34637 [Diplonema papillatum]